MPKEALPKNRVYIQLLISLVLYVGSVHTLVAKTTLPVNANISIIDHTIVLHSNSFNAQKRSSFKISGERIEIERGLTLVHLNPEMKFEYKTFDTHSSADAAKEFVEIAKRLLDKKERFAILAHDSAAKALSEHAKALAKIGLRKLSTIKHRQAYVMHNFKGAIFEKIDDLSIALSTEAPKNIKKSSIYFPKKNHDYTPSTDRYIAHAGGEVDGHPSTNSKAALDQNYAKGFRMFELDIIETSDGKLVAAHDWNMWSRFTDYSGELPPTLAEFKKHNIYGDYETLDLEGINAWFSAHPDATLVTDKLNDPIGFAEKFIDKSRLIMELFSLMTVEEASKHGLNAMISQKPFMKIPDDKLNYLKVNNIQYVALSRRKIASNLKLLEKLKENGIKVYVYHVNFDEGKDEKYVRDNEIGIVYGMYADKWVFDKPKEKVSK